jgi:uncharacterized membrane protein YhhN
MTKSGGAFMVLTYLDLAAYVLFSAIQCVGIFLRKKKVSSVTKPLLMPLLLVFYLLAAKQPDALVAGALVLGLLGDIFLMGKDSSFAAGLLAFLSGHLLYIISFLRRLEFSSVSGWVLLAAPVFVLYGIIIYRKLTPYLGNVSKKMITAYVAVLLCMSFAALSLFVSSISAAAVAIFAGSLLFIASDSLLASDLFTGEKRWRTTLVMLTYTAAQGLIVAGLL